MNSIGFDKTSLKLFYLPWNGFQHFDTANYSFLSFFRFLVSPTSRTKEPLGFDNWYGIAPSGSKIFFKYHFDF